MSIIGSIKKLQFNDGKYIKFRVPSPFDTMDIDVPDKATDSFLMASEVALAVTDWNGAGTVDPLALIADKAKHADIFAVSRAIDKAKPKIPKFTVEENSDALKIYNDNFYCLLRPLTVLQFMDLVSDVRESVADDFQSIFKCKTIATPLIDWNGEGKLSTEALYDNVEHHIYVVGVDKALSEFFLSNAEYTVCDDSGVLDSSNDNGRNDDSEPSNVEPKEDAFKGFSVNVARV